MLLVEKKDDSGERQISISSENARLYFPFTTLRVGLQNRMPHGFYTFKRRLSQWEMQEALQLPLLIILFFNF